MYTYQAINSQAVVSLVFLNPCSHMAIDFNYKTNSRCALWLCLEKGDIKSVGGYGIEFSCGHPKSLGKSLYVCTCSRD